MARPASRRRRAGMPTGRRLGARTREIGGSLSDHRSSPAWQSHSARCRTGWLRKPLLKQLRSQRRCRAGQRWGAARGRIVYRPYEVVAERRNAYVNLRGNTISLWGRVSDGNASQMGTQVSCPAVSRHSASERRVQSSHRGGTGCTVAFDEWLAAAVGRFEVGAESEDPEAGYPVQIGSPKLPSFGPRGFERFQYHSGSSRLGLSGMHATALRDSGGLIDRVCPAGVGVPVGWPVGGRDGPGLVSERERGPGHEDGGRQVCGRPDGGLWQPVAARDR